MIGKKVSPTPGQGQTLWSRAKEIIPGGNMLLSKRSELFLPDGWPSYFSRAKGISVWDLDGQKFTDMSSMGIGTNLLGYANPRIDSVVRRAIRRGTMSTLNSPEEVELAERLLEINPWSDMVKLARTGGEANAVAVRIGRAASGRDRVAVCGYHGWHDWYLASNLKDHRSLDGHLLPGLEPKGVPQALSGTVEAFRYNDIEALEEIVRKGDVGVIKMEVFRNQEPEADFLQRVRRLATSSGAVLIFDECTSGFRETFGGLHKKYGVDPDIAVYGKALGNGYPITAVVGRRSVMDAAQSTFISSTFWTERIGPVAALETLRQMEDLRSWEKVTDLGKYYRQVISQVFTNREVGISFSGLPAISTFVIGNTNHQEWKTLITEKMLDKSYLASTLFYPSILHTRKIIDRYASQMDELLIEVTKLGGERAVPKMLKYPVAQSGFSRLN